MNCKCGKLVNYWDTFCYYCGTWLQISPSESSLENGSANSVISYDFNFNDVRHFTLPNPDSSNTRYVNTLFGRLILASRSQISFLEPSSNEVLDEVKVNAAKPELIGYLRPNVLVPVGGGITLYHLGSQQATITIPVLGEITTPPAIYDREPIKRAFFGHSAGILVVEQSPASNASRPAVKTHILGLDLDPLEKLRKPLRVKNRIMALTSRGRLIRLNAEVEIEALKKSLKIEGELFSRDFAVGVPIAINELIFFETVSYGKNRKATVSLKGFDSTKSEFTLRNMDNWSADQLDWAFMNLNEQREFFSPIVTGHNSILLSAPDFSSFNLYKWEGKDWKSVRIDLSDFSSRICHWNCLAFKRGYIMVADYTKGKIGALSVENPANKLPICDEISIDENDAIRSAPVFMLHGGHGVIYLVTGNQIHIFQEQTK